LALGLATLALGQQPRQQPPQPNVLGPLADPALQKELKLSDEQITKLKDALNKVMGNHKGTLERLQQMPPEEQQKKMQAIQDDSQKAIAGILDEKQMKRFKQIMLQMNGVAALMDPQVQKELKLSDEQKKKLDGVFNDGQKRMQDMARTPGASREEFQKKYEAILKDIEDKTNGVLSEDQKKSFKEMKGAPFEAAQPKGGR
jgi:hypothetical protein